MGGFRVNGCGVTDHFKKIKSLGFHMCPNCGNMVEFFLEEARQKNDVFFIPTLTLKSRCAVMCSKCGQGQFCSDQWAFRLMQTNGPITGIFESNVQEAGKPEPLPEPEPKQQAPIVKLPLPEPEPQASSAGPSVPNTEPQTPFAKPPVPKMETPFGKRAAPSFFKCPKCGVTQLRQNDFCSFCGSPAPEQEEKEALRTENRNEEAGPQAPAFCPNCGGTVDKDMKFCILCGQKLQ